MNVICPLCKGINTVLIADKVRFGIKANVHQCQSCTLVFLDQASFSFPSDFYQTQYHQTYLTHIDPEMLDPARHFKKMIKASKPWIERVKLMLTGNEAVLDVGCSTGHFLTSIRDRAKKVAGHELSVKEVSFCRDKLNLDVSNQPLEKRFAPGTFDLITMIFVLEHIGNPVSFLFNLKQYLKPGGRLIIVVPNIQDPLMTFFNIPSFPEFYYCIEHVFYYSQKTLASVLKHAGFLGKPEPVQEYPLSNHLNWIYRQKPTETLSARRIVPDIELKKNNYLIGWESLWNEFDNRYRLYMESEGFSDRLWCVTEEFYDKGK